MLKPREVETTLGKLVEAQPALSSVASKLDGKTVPMKAKYHVGKLLRLVNAEIRGFHEQRNDLVKELGSERDPTLDERKRGQIEKIHEVTPENGPLFVRRMKELGDVSVAIPWAPIELSVLNETLVTALEIEALLDAGLAVFEAEDKEG